ncbi:MAG: glycosyltransferase [Chloroflexi bacterium]|nr:glycosyltransferase [Chloroflexota bacterium]
MVEGLYVASLLILAIYGLNSLILTAIFWLKPRPRAADVVAAPATADVPVVTVQLPIFNERYVVERLLGAIGALDYPRQRLQIQVLDDSTDETREIVDRLAARMTANGHWIEVVRRAQPHGFKGGALADAMPRVRGEFIAIFDADFLPRPDYLRQMLPSFTDPRVGCVQGRWDHVNADYSLLTRIQAAGIDGHFIVEQEARNRMGWFMAFNGSAGIWRRACIDAAGGWQGDTLTEDLDLSFRAQLAGWQFRFRTDVAVPAEVPAQIDAYKRQQFRWAKGSVQTIKKLLPMVWMARLPLMVKVQATLQLGGYLMHPLMVIAFILALPMSVEQSPLFSLLPYLMGALFGSISLYTTAMMRRGGSGARPGDRPHSPLSSARHAARFVSTMVMLIVLGTGMSLNNTRAAVEAILGVDNTFKRTPKFDLRSRADQWWHKRYSLPRDPIVLAELLAAVAALAFYVVGNHEAAGRVSQWLLIYAMGYGYVGGLSIWQNAGGDFRLRRR